MTHVDLAFPVCPRTIPEDHGYALYSGLCHLMPSLHGAEWLGVHPLNGVRVADSLVLNSRSRLRLRIPVERIRDVLALAGRTLWLGKTGLTVGAPTVHPLVPAASLDARLVVVKLTDVPRQPSAEARSPLDRHAMAERVTSELSRQLSRLGTSAQPELCGHGRIGIGRRRVVGFAVRVRGLSPEASLRLQVAGLGGKRRMGCGIFRPSVAQ